jgi:hypothetical protein
LCRFISLFVIFEDILDKLNQLIKQEIDEAHGTTYILDTNKDGTLVDCIRLAHRTGIGAGGDIHPALG